MPLRELLFPYPAPLRLLLPMRIEIAIAKALSADSARMSAEALGTLVNVALHCIGLLRKAIAFFCFLSEGFRMSLP
jgi:hypothetical protein